MRFRYNEKMMDTKEAIVREMEGYFKGDTRRIEHAHKVTGFVEQLWQSEGGDYGVVIAAGLLHDIGIHNAEKKYNSNSGKYQEIEGPPVAREILTRLKRPSSEIEEVCRIIAHHHSPGKNESPNFKVLYDADWLVNLGDEFDVRDKSKLKSIIHKVFLTTSGRDLARRIYDIKK
jgi:HD superfamily phosphodiesterase